MAGATFARSIRLILLFLLAQQAHSDNTAIFRRRRSGSSDQLMAHFAAVRQPKIFYRQPTYVLDLWKELNDKENEAEGTGSNGQAVSRGDLMALLNGQRRYRCRYRLAKTGECD